MGYQKWELERDWNFGQELLNKFGLKDFKVTYKPSTIQWLFWHRYLDEYCIKQEIEKIQYYNEKMSFNYQVEPKSEFIRLLPTIKDIHQWIYPMTKMQEEDYIDVFSGFCGSGHTIEEFRKWIHETLV